MAKYSGHKGSVQVGAVEIGEVESFDVNIEVDELNANVMGQDWTAVINGQMTASGSISVLRDNADPGQTALAPATIVTLSLYPEGNTTGLSSITGDFLISSEGITSSVGDTVKTSYNIRNAGAVTIGSVA